MRERLDAFEKRTKTFAIATIRLGITLEKFQGLRFVSNQLVRAAGSVAANHRAMRRARSDREFAAKLQIVNEEIDEAVLWLEIVDEIRPDLTSQNEPVLVEARQLRAMFARARATTRQNLGPQ